jgi:peptidoglycan hydrolase CwlO-like protein|tara:strand:+ start:207 stop:473 length:267 start_codon:yes stop_codon:yes gene_type:complete
MTNSDITHLTQAIMELKGQIERMSERQEEMVDDVKKIKEAVYNPDEGLYARLRALEQWKENQAKVQWAVITTVIGLVAATVYKMILSS